MSAELSLMQALLGPLSSSQDARLALENALLADVEPLHWCAVHLGLTDAEIMRRGALWADLAFFDVVPRDAEAPPEPMRLEMLGQVRSCRLLLFGRTILFAAPGFFDLLRLARMRRDQPMLRARLCLIPGTALREHLLDHAAPALMDNARQNLARIWPRAAAHIELTKPVRWTAAIMILILALLALLAPLSGQLWLVPLWAAMVILPTLIRFAALFSVAGPEIEPVPGQDRADLPLYSILVPLRDEANMVDQICANLRRIDYPGEKLQILFVVESRSPRTIAAIRRHLWDMRFALVVVPDAAPRTKPKALDFALPLCRGEFVVVYDAEDRPDPDQLLRMVAQFRGEPDITCIQARLVIGNGGEGSLPALFAGEYAGLFAVLLPALARWGLLVPLGGTSNHFRVAQLRQLGGWDAFNVTEDADLGVRLARRGLRTATSTSRTFEDAPVGLGAWMGQRTRWMKGWLQTLVVHNCHPLLLRHDLGWRGTLLFEILILGMLLAPLLHAGFIFTLVGLYFTETLAWPSGGIWPLTCLGALFFGHGVAIATNLLGLRRTGQPYLSHWQALLPAYWLLMAWATLRALHEFAVRPFHWFKTPHRTSPTQRSRAGRQTQFVRRPILR